MLKLAYFSPLAPVRSGISDYSHTLLAYLLNKARVDLWVDGLTPTDPRLQRECGIVDFAAEPDRLGALEGYDGVIYQQANELKYHRRIYEVSLLYPGVSVLHDFSLHPFIATYWLDYKKDGDGYLREMAYAHGEDGARVARATLKEVQAGRWQDVPWETAPLRYPLNRRVLRRSKGVIVHSDFARQRIEEMEPDLPVATVAHPELDEGLPQETPPPPLAAQLKGYPGFVVVSLGFATNNKGLDVALKAFAALRKRGAEAVYLLVGEVMPSFPLGSVLAELGLKLGEDVLTTGYVEDPALLNLYLDLCHVCISLRRRTMGETSGVAVRALARGRPLVVSDVGWFGDLPNDCVVKVSSGLGEADRLAAYLVELHDNPALRDLLGKNARRYAETHCVAEMVADQYVKFCGRVGERAPLDPCEPEYVREEALAQARTPPGESSLDEIVRSIEREL